ncbi:MAG: endopeptidase La, partial [Clostridia bacterium]|nr:endopeptidase La [Clostridia bacterium]
MEETLKIIPCIPLRGKIILPNTTLSIDVGRPKSVSAVKNATEHGGEIFICAQRSDSVDNPTQSDLYEVGVIALVRQVNKSGANLRVTVQSVARASLISFTEGEEYYTASVAPLSYVSENAEEAAAAVRVVKDLLSQFPPTNNKATTEAFRNLLSISDANVLCNTASQQMGLSKEEKQAVLAESRTETRLTLLATALSTELEIVNAQKKITEEVRKSIDKNQKEYFLREQIKAIHKELGDDEAENEKIVAQIKAKPMPEAIREKALKEMARLDKMVPSSPESTVIRNYIDLILELPFMEGTEDNNDVIHAETVLNEDHFGLEKVKRRVVEYLAVHALTKTLKGPILCFVGPPGVGKTSIARSIARAMGRKFVRMSLGGLKDEAEIRGHRRTYIGAMPGRIIYEIRSAKANNPVFLLDEIDKISSDMRGDPASALLEVLDPEQNATYRDRYLEEEFNLSNVMFVATANTLDTIPAPLRDRMEIIEISGYTTEEKVQIAKKYLLPKKLAEHGLGKGQITVTDGAFRKMAERYTMEAGVRNLERVVADVCRKYAVSYVKDPSIGSVKVTEQNLEKYLGKPKYTLSNAMQEDNVGVCNGLAWTAVGGVTLEVEVNLMPGKGELKLTGSLGDVMKESALTALSYIRANAESFGIDSSRFEKTDIHLHVPEGATPKDGPSAGITIATALYSAFTGKKVKKSVAMTGEITLRGRVLPIGGLKEKSLAAIRRGVT